MSRTGLFPPTSRPFSSPLADLFLGRGSEPAGRDGAGLPDQGRCDRGRVKVATCGSDQPPDDIRKWVIDMWLALTAIGLAVCLQ
jgi:hypothetical protein